VHVQRQVSVVKMATVLEVCTTEEQRSAVYFYGQKNSVQRIFIKRCVLFIGGKCLSHKAGHDWVTTTHW
jgi:hypothetical protein